MSSPFSRSWIGPKISRIGPDGAISFKTSGWDNDDVHWTSQEKFLCSDELYPAMQWIFENRNALPYIIEKRPIPADLFEEAPFTPPSDGLYTWCEDDLVDGWAALLAIPVTLVNPESIPRDLQLLARLTEANCFLFVHGVCEAAILLGREETERQVVPEQALWLLKRALREIERCPRRET